MLLPLLTFSLRDEEKSRRSVGDGLHVFLIVAAVVAHQQEVGDSHDAHQEQEGDDTFSKQVARRATEREKKMKQTNGCKHTQYTVGHFFYL